MHFRNYQSILLDGGYSSEELSVLGKKILYYRSVGKHPIAVQNLSLLDSYQGPTVFDHCLVDYGNFFKEGINSGVGDQEEKKFIEDNASWLHIVGDKLQVDRSLSIIRDIASKDLVQVRNSGLDVVYRQQLAVICRDLGEYVDGKSMTEENVVVPLRGGLLAASLLPDFDVRKVIPIDCKRLPINDYVGHFGFGMSFRYFSENTRTILAERYEDSKDKSLRILEVAVGSGITTIGIILDLYMRNLKPKLVRVITPVATVVGLDLIHKTCEYLDINLEVYVSAVCPRLGDYYHDRNDSLVDENGKYVIGNASNILAAFLHLDDLETMFESRGNPHQYDRMFSI